MQFPSNYLKNVIDILKQIPASRRMSHREHALGRDERRGEGGREKKWEEVGLKRENATLIRSKGELTCMEEVMKGERK